MTRHVNIDWTPPSPGSYETMERPMSKAERKRQAAAFHNSAYELKKVMETMSQQSQPKFVVTDQHGDGGTVVPVEEPK